MAIGNTNIGIKALNDEFGYASGLEHSIGDFFSFSDGRGISYSNWHGQQTIGLAGGLTGNYYQSVGQAFQLGTNQALSLWAGYDHFAPFVLDWRINNNTAGADVDYIIRLVASIGGVYPVGAGTVLSGTQVGTLWTAPGAFPFDDPWTVGDYRIEVSLAYGRGSGGPAIVMPNCSDLYGPGIGTEGQRDVDVTYINWNLEPPPLGFGDIAMTWMGAFDNMGVFISQNRATQFIIDIN